MADLAAGYQISVRARKITLGNLEYKSSAKDDPMGLSPLLTDSAPVDDGSSLNSAEVAQVPTEGDGGNDLDAMKGKGKGKRKGWL